MLFNQNNQVPDLAHSVLLADSSRADKTANKPWYIGHT